jgi:hypothetical protein
LNNLCCWRWDPYLIERYLLLKMRSTSNWKIFCCRRWGPHLILEKSRFELRWEGLYSAALLPCPGILRSPFSLYECIDFVRIILASSNFFPAGVCWFLWILFGHCPCSTHPSVYCANIYHGITHLHYVPLLL